MKYNVECVECGKVFTPGEKSSLWWMAKKHADQGYLDAVHVSGTQCGCVESLNFPEAPFRVFGFDDECREFNFPLSTFSDAVRQYLVLRRGLNVVFIKGVSQKVERRLDWM